MRLVLINQFFPPDPAPTGRLLKDLADALHAGGHEVCVLTSRQAYRDEDPASQQSQHSYKVIRVGPRRRHRRHAVGKLMDYLGFLIRGRRELNRMESKPDAVLCMTSPPFCGLLGLHMQEKFGVPYFLWCMDLYPEALMAADVKLPGVVMKAMKQLAADERRKSSCVVSIGPDMSQILGRTTAQDSLLEIPVWADGVDVEKAEARRDEIRKMLGWGEDEIVFLYCGNMGRAHRVDEFGLLAEGIKAEGTSCRFVFRGQGARKEQWRKAWGDLFEWPDPGDGMDYMDFLIAADVHLVSQEEAWRGVVVPSKFQSAVATGRPVLFAGPNDAAVAAWIREADCGWVLPVGGTMNEEEKSALLNDRERRMRGKRGRVFFEIMFKKDLCLQSLIERIESIKK